MRIYVNVFLVTVCAALIICGDSAPMSSFIDDAASDINADVQRLLMNQELKREVMGKWPTGDDTDDMAFNSSGFRRLIARKRMEAQKRNNRGGVSLCLWKVCPAGPWLSSK